MKKYILLSISIIGLSAVLSCKKSSSETVAPDPFVTSPTTGQKTKCNLSKIQNEKGVIKSSFDYDVNKKLSKIINNEEKTTIAFVYNSKGKIEKMNFLKPNPEDSFSIIYTYDESGSKVVKTKASVQNYEFLNNILTYNGDKIARVTSDFDLFGAKVQVQLRIEYNGDNISKVFSRTDNDKEILVFEATKYDDKLNFYPDNYRMFALGFLSLGNSYYGYLGKNNPISMKIYDEKNDANMIEMLYEYDKNGVVTKNTVNSTAANGIKNTRSEAYQFIDCK
jgi:CRISPR/Cas system CMR-associated protein Cmr5 small subunit